jgi:hypothetical protein
MHELKRGWSVANVYDARFRGLPFDGQWFDAIGTPELGHSWAIVGNSGSGKTTFNMMLAKYISQFEDVVYNSLEEGLSLSIPSVYNRVGIDKGSNILLVSEPMKEFAQRLKRHKSANVAFIDSILYTRMRWSDYRAFCDAFPKKILIWVGHEKANKPKGALAEDIWYDSFVKIRTEGYRAFISSRFALNPKGEIDIWPEGAQNYWGLNF